MHCKCDSTPKAEKRLYQTATSYYCLLLLFLLLLLSVLVLESSVTSLANYSRKKFYVWYILNAVHVILYATCIEITIVVVYLLFNPLWYNFFASKITHCITFCAHFVSLDELQLFCLAVALSFDEVRTDTNRRTKHKLM